MKKYSFILLLTLLYTVNILSQEAYPIITDSILNKGIYASFDEFINNSPSKELFFDYEKSEPIIDEYLLKKDGEKIKPKDIWGFCDGESVFYFSKINRSFFKFLEVGSISYLISRVNQRSNVFIGNIASGVSVTESQEYYFDLAAKELGLLTNKRMKELEAKCPSAKRYKKIKINLYYIKNYNSSCGVRRNNRAKKR